MFNVDELLSKRNQKEAFGHLSKKDGCGIDGLRVSELPHYWKLNGNRIMGEIRSQSYIPGIVLMREIVNNKGKRRMTSSLPALDRFLTRLLSQKLERCLSPVFYEQSYAYQENKSTLDAVMRLKVYLEEGNPYLLEIDIKDFFDTVSLERMEELLHSLIRDKAVITLLHHYLYCYVSQDGKVSRKSVGLVQGSALSPILSNLYLQDLDMYLQEHQYKWVRYADNIYIVFPSFDEAIEVFNTVTKLLNDQFFLQVNKSKSGVFEPVGKRILGYDVQKKGKSLSVQKHEYKAIEKYINWHDAKLETRNGRYHIVSDGIINKQDYGLLFENEEKKYFIPVEVVDQINVYSNITIAPNVLKTISARGIKIYFFDKNGNLEGVYYPKATKTLTSTLEKQCLLSCGKERIAVARSMEIAALHNIRFNLRYYAKQQEGLLEAANTISDYITDINQATTINEMMLIEAKARQLYYKMFNHIVSNTDFYFTQRTKQPPKDALNACISFGNTLLYNQFASICWKKGIHTKFGIIHYSERREQSLNFDFADIYKPIITDRIIFTLINKRVLDIQNHFEVRTNGGVYLSPIGKKVFIKAFEEKLSAKIHYKDKQITYRQLLEIEVQNYKNFLLKETSYRPYKYY